MSEEDGEKTNGVNHGDESTALSEPVLLGATQTGSVMQHTVRKCFSLPPYHVTKVHLVTAVRHPPSVSRTLGHCVVLATISLC